MGYAKLSVNLSGMFHTVRATAPGDQIAVQVDRLNGELAGGAYTDVRAQFYDRLQQLYGEPGSSSTIARLIFEPPTSRSTNEIGTSTTRKPLRSAR